MTVSASGRAANGVARERARPRLSMNVLAYGDYGLAAALEDARRLGAPLAVHRRSLDQLGRQQAAELVRDAGVQVSYVMHSSVFTLDRPERWDEEADAFRDTLGTALELGADSVCITSGRAGELSWDEAAERLAEAAAPLLAEASAAGVDVVVEPTGQLRQDLGFVHALRDVVELARRTGLGVCIDSFWCLRERDLVDTVIGAADLIRLVQISDNPPGVAEPGDRMVPGDGIADLPALVGALGRIGYSGWVDLELLGPRIQLEGPSAAVERGLSHLARLLDRPRLRRS